MVVFHFLKTFLDINCKYHDFCVIKMFLRYLIRLVVLMCLEYARSGYFDIWFDSGTSWSNVLPGNLKQEVYCLSGSSEN